MASLTHPEEAHHVKKGSHVMLKGHPVKVSEVKTSKTGKHGHAKCNMTGSCVLCSKKCNEVYPGHIIIPGFHLEKVHASRFSFFLLSFFLSTSMV
jgi:translation elongation factor P/translation initiation factor 5A